MPSTITIQNIVNFAATQTELMPLANVGSYTNEPALSIANDVMAELLSPPNPWKFNRKEMPPLFLQRGKQDYLFAGACAFALDDAKGVGIDLVTNSGISETSFTVTVKTLDNHAFVVGETIYITGATVAAYNSVFTQTPNSSAWSGGWVVTGVTAKTFTFTHTSSGLAVSGSAGITDYGSLEACTMVDPGSGNSPQGVRILSAVRMLEVDSRMQTPEKICVVADLGTGVLKFRFFPLPGSTGWQVSPVYQAKVPLKTALTDTWTPFPDEYSFVFRQMFLAKALMYANSPRSEVEYQKAQMAIMKGLGRDDRELSEEFIVPSTPLSSYDLNSGAWWL